MRTSTLLCLSLLIPLGERIVRTNARARRADRLRPRRRLRAAACTGAGTSVAHRRGDHGHGSAWPSHSCRARNDCGAIGPQRRDG